jgi:LacI family transcriptional regulator
MGKAVSIADVARHAGVSVSTVSLVMNNRPNVAPDTAEAVWHSVKTLGYRPGGMSGKKRGPKPGPRRSVIAPHILLLQLGGPPASFRGDVYAALTHGLMAAAKPRSASLSLFHTEDAPEARALLRRTSPDGVVVIGEVRAPSLRDALRRTACVQAFGALPDDGAWDHVTVDRQAAVRQGCRWLRERGHSRCALWTLGAGPMSDLEDTFCLTVSKNGGDACCMSAAECVAFDGIFPRVDADHIGDLVSRMMDGEAAPTGVFLATELLAPVFCRAAAERGLERGTDLDVVCSSLQGPTLTALRPAPAIVDIQPELVGMQAVDQVIWRMDHCNEPRVTRLVAPSIIPPG